MCLRTLLGFLLLTSAALAQAPPGLETTRDQASYAIGLNIGRDLTSSGAELNAAAVLRGIQDVLARRQPALTDEQCRAAVTAFQREVDARELDRRRTVGAQNRQQGQAFLAANGSKPGVVTLPSGLQYQVLKKGNGPSPKGSDTVTTHYHGTFIDGTVFDSSVDRGQPATFNVGQVIRGWTEALQLMKVGDKWRLFVPSQLAYGADGFGRTIGPHATLIFEVELLGIK